ncbi:MAG: hypothetical protein JW908_00595 [Anaerolineales bacterium]|nr:hypothetical protein [Anaerolineales bacterium]
MPYASKALSSSDAVKTGVGSVIAVVLAAGSDAATVTLYDNTAGSGTVITKLTAVANTAETAVFPEGIPFSTGCYAVITGTSPVATIEYG